MYLSGHTIGPQLKSVRNYQRSSISFPKILDAIERFTKVRIFLILLYIAFLSPKILGFLFTTKKNLTWRVKCEKSNFGKSWRIYWKSSSKIVHEWNGHLEIFSRPQVIENSRQYSLLWTDILKKTVVGCPWNQSTLSNLW